MGQQASLPPCRDLSQQLSQDNGRGQPCASNMQCQEGTKPWDLLPTGSSVTVLSTDRPVEFPLGEPSFITVLRHTSSHLSWEGCQSFMPNLVQVQNCFVEG